MISSRQITHYISSGMQYLWSIGFLLFPLFFLTLTTEVFVMPKQILITIAVLVSIIGLGLQMLFEKKIKIRSTVFDLPIVLFILALLLSTLFSLSRADALIAYVPIL